MFPVDQNHIDSEHNNGGYSSLDSELVNLRPSSGQTLLNATQLQQQQQQQPQTKSPAVTVDTKQQNHITQSNSNSKKSVMLNLKSGAINSTVEEFSRFSDTFTTNGRRNRVWLIAIAIAIGCLCCFAFGLSFNHLFDTQPCDERHHRKMCVTEDCIRTASSLLSAMNRSVDPCDNFFQFACGAWNKKNVIPEDKSSFTTFEVLADQQQVILRQLLEEAVNQDDNRATIKAKHFYKSCVDIHQIRSIGDKPLKELLKYYGGWPVLEKNWKKPNQSLEEMLGTMHGELNEHFLVSMLVAPDDKNSSVNILVVDQLILALPSREYYLKGSSKIDLMAYHNYMTKIAIILGADPATAADDMQEVLDFETQLANASLSEIERHDTSSVYHKLTLTSLKTLVPEIKWDVYMRTSFAPSTHIADNEPIVAYAVPYLVQLGRLISDTDERIIRNYVLWRMVFSLVSHFIDEYQKERIEFQRILLGIRSERHRWSQCVDWTNKKIGLAVGALFIRENFNSESKESALEMIHLIREAFNELLDENDWMDDETRAVAKEKANSMNERIGYPEILTNVTELEKEYANLTINENNFFENILNILKWDSQRQSQMLRKPVEKHKWATEPAVVNAFYNPNRNDIVFPAGILQPQFYSAIFPKSLNYGGIGVVIGHEITHGFDDKGRQFDKDGNMKQWWNNATITAFRNRAQCIIDQYSRYKVNELGMYMNGKLTQSENIADNGGLKQAFRAYKKWVKQHGTEEELPGLELTHDQLFFLNYAQIWCGSMRPEDALSKLRSSVHSPGVIRVIGPLSNSKEFSDAYKCKLGSQMNPTNKCSVW